MSGRCRLFLFFSTLLAGFTGCTEMQVVEWCEAPQASTEVSLLVGADLPVLRSELTEMWRLDGLEDGHELVTPAAVALDPTAGRMAIADFGLTEIAVISLDGEWLGRWGRSGQGPGELTVAVAAQWTPGGRLAVYDPLNSKVVRLGEPGAEPLPDEPIEPAFSATVSAGLGWALLQPGGVVVVQPNPRGRAVPDAEHLVLRGGPRGQPVDTLAAVSVPSIQPPGYAPMPLPGWALPTAAVSGDTLVALAGDVPHYRVRVTDGQGVVFHQLCRPGAPAPPSLPAQDLEAAEEVPGLIEAMQEGPEPDRLPAIGRLAYDSDERLWVQRGPAGPFHVLDRILGREGALYDVYGPDLEPWTIVEMPPRVRMIGATGELVVGLERGRFDELSIVGYRLER